MIELIVNELETIAVAFGKTFKYNRLSEVNTMQGKDYPLILIESIPEFVRGKTNNKFLPRFKEYNLKIFVFDQYEATEEDIKKLQEKQGEVENIMEQYLAEIQSRTAYNTSKGFRIIGMEGLTGFLAHKVHNDKLVEVVYKVKFQIDKLCTPGTFNY